MALKFQLTIVTITTIASVVWPMITCGGEVINPISQEVVECGKFAVEEHNKQNGTKLAYETVIRAERRIADGFKYKLKIEAADGNVSDLYQAVVWVPDWEGYKRLVSFKKLKWIYA